mgnify:CR=1 FL=1
MIADPYFNRTKTNQTIRSKYDLIGNIVHEGLESDRFVHVVKISEENQIELSRLVCQIHQF